MNVTVEHLQEAVDQLEPSFDTHAVIQLLTRLHPRAYIEDLYDRRLGSNPFRTAHADIGRLLGTLPSVVKDGRGSSANVRGDETENQHWRKV